MLFIHNIGNDINGGPKLNIFFSFNVYSKLINISFCGRVGQDGS